MNINWIKQLFKIVICTVSLASVAFAYLQEQNALTQLRILIPQLEQQLFAMKEQNSRLLYQIEQFESPANLMKLAKQCEYSHLSHPYADDILVVKMAPEWMNDPLMIKPQERYSLQPTAILAKASE